MGVLTKEQIIEMIRERGGLSKNEVERRIREIASREGISEHAAALILAEELGVNLETEGETLHIADLVPGMRGVNVVAGVLRKYPPREYTKKDGSKGLVANVILYDSTGKTRLVLWDGLVTKYYNELDRGSVVKIIDPVVKEGRNGVELHANFRTRIIIDPDDPRVAEIPPIEEVRSYSYQRKSIGDLVDGDRFVEVRGTIVRLYRVTAYDACPQCRKKVDYDPSTDAWICPEHGEVQPVKVVIFDFGIDDSTGYIRVTLFGDAAAELIGENPEEIAGKLKKLVEDGLTLREAGRKMAEEEYYHLLGKEIVVRGNVLEDKFLGLMLRASGWDEVDPRREISRVRAELKGILRELV
ncbi:replication factor A [Thermococcus sp. P6]|uniref:OB-fold nucleic acid binding domain-containing protein n=1 Tax=Thermococcus sp. P6 TaxID=122420 RepID=UPI000B5A1443|nr:OB-fold nucleic acid binding domain-containing protein [Thermococcus sp. P6]ASJ10429.1 replication factor A [Thermococcus sp. P6]